MINGQPNPAFFKRLQSEYVSKTGYNLVLSDLNGSIQMGLPDCDKFPCMMSCRECRERIFSESLRTGKKLFALPIHICPTVAKYEKAHIVVENELRGTWTISARDSTETGRSIFWWM